jgi:putative oxidoreductase
MTTAVVEKHKPLKILNFSLWVSQVIVAAMFAMAGSAKATQPIAELSTRMPWAADIPEALVRFIGISELAGAIGLVLPALTRIRPGLTPLAAAGLTTIMVLAAVFHAARGGEGAGIIVNVVIGSLTAFIAWGRYRKVPITPG